MTSAISYDFTTPANVSEASVGDYFTLMKPKVMSLVIFSGFAGLWVADSTVHHIHPFLAAVAMLCLAVNAGAAGAINMAWEADIDSIMRRTMNRPIPQGRVTKPEAMTLGVAFSLASVMIMGLALNWLAAGLLAAANLFYVFVYTIWLKRSTPQNIVIGGAAGAFPPLIFIWTPPHFWALSLFANEDYKRANIPMMTVVAGPRSTKIQMLIYAALLLPLTISPYFLGLASARYAIAAAILSCFFVFTSVRVLLSDNLKHAKLMFGYSVFYLFALFLAIMIG